VFIAAIEGADLVGKTSVCQELSRRGYTIRRQPTTPEIREFIKIKLIPEGCPSDIIALAMALDRRLDEFRHPYQGFVITDRSIISSLVMNVDEQSPLGYVLSINWKTTLPDAVIWLRANPETIQERLSKRRDQDLFDTKTLQTLKDYEEKIPKLKRLFVNMVFHEVFVDGKSVEEIADEIEIFLRPYRFLDDADEHFQMGTVKKRLKNRLPLFHEVWDWIRRGRRNHKEI